MASFSNLPVELRQIIIQHVLHGRRESPSTPSRSNRVPLEDSGLITERWQRGGCGVYYEASNKQFSTNCLPLLLTNRQISAETKSVLDLLETDYVLDISVLNDLDLFLTWITVPRLTHRINHLRTEVRLFGHVIPTTAARCQGGDGGSTGIEFAFHQVLQRFLMDGPVGQKKGGNNDGYKNRNISVRTLELDFTSSEEGFPFPPDEFHWRDYLLQLRGRGKLDEWKTEGINAKGLPIWVSIPKYKTRPEWMARWVCLQISRIVRCSDFYGVRYGSMIYENVGTVRVSVDGTPMEDLDLSHCPESAVARREELGFSFIRPNIARHESEEEESG